jgi:hypothetical protein
MSTRDPITVIQDFDAAWNAHDLDRALSFFTDDAVVRLVPAPPGEGEYAGKAQIREWAQGLMTGFQVASSDHQLSGDRITWRFRVSSDAFRSMGIDPVEGTSEATLQGDRLRSFTVTFSPETVSKMQGM